MTLWTMGYMLLCNLMNPLAVSSGREGMRFKGHEEVCTIVPKFEIEIRILSGL